MKSRFVRVVVVCAALLSLVIDRADTVRAVSTTVVISEFRTRGVNGAADEFVELYNASSAPVNIGGWKINGSNATAGVSTRATITANTTIGAGCYYLVTNSSASGGPYSGTVTGNQTFTVGITDDGGVALMTAANVIVDQAGMSNGSAYKEGTVLAPLTTTGTNRTYERKPGGAAGNGTDTDNNASDFQINAASNPQNASSTCTSPQGNTLAAAMTANPASVVSDGSTELTVTVTGGTAPYAVTGNLQQIGGAALQAFTDAGGSQFKYTAVIPASVTTGPKTVFASVSDANGGTTQAQVTVTVTQQVSAPPTGSGSANPSSVPGGGTTQITVNATPGTNPASTGLTVMGDLSAIGGSAAVPFQLVSGNTFTTSATVATSTPFGVRALPITVSDAQGRSSAFSLPVIVTPPGAGKVLINEIDADTPGVDAAEFVELYDGGTGHTPLDGLVLVLYNGTNEAAVPPTPTGDQSYVAFDLDGFTTDANGYFVLGNPGVPGAGLIFDPGPFGLLQNGPDAAALYVGDAADFPNGTVVTTTNLLDAVVYGTNDPNPSNLMTLINSGQLIVNEDGNGNGTIESSQRCPNGMGGIRNSSPYRQAAPTPGAANGCPAQAPASDVVISQIYGGGGNAGATYHNDFVELYNRGTTTVDLGGWSIQYASSTGSGWDTNLQPLGGTIAAGEYYLIALAAGTATTGPQQPLPAANIVGQINLSGTTGKVALVGTFDPLTGNCPLANPDLRDFIGYGSADCGEGATTAATLSNTTAALRQDDGRVDTNVNRNDFAAASPTPRRTAPIVEIGPFVLNTDPRRGALSAPRDATVHVTFTEPVEVFDPWFDINCASTGHHTDATFAGGGRERYITPNANFQAGEQCTVTIFKDQIHDLDLDDSDPNTDTLRANVVWSFTIATGTPAPYPPGVHLTLGNPSGAVASIGQPDNYLMEKPEFALSYNRDLGRPNWVSWHLSDEWTGTLERVDTFRPDPAVPPDWYRVQSFDFAGSGFDRGHMTPNADRDQETSIPINQATFLMSNMVAQAPANNQGPWAALEGYLRTLVETPEQNELYIVAGPQGVGGSGSNRDQNNEPFVTTTLADGHVTVPAWTWKVVLVLPKDSGDDASRVTCTTRTIAVILPNTQAVNSDWQTYLTTVDAVETLTGYDFFSTLPEPIQQCVEAGVNGNNPPLVKGNQTITFPAPPDHAYGDAPFTVSATGGASGNPVTFAASGACTSGGFSGATISINSAGSCTVTASQAGSDLYNAAPDVVRTLTVNKATAVIVVNNKSRSRNAPNPPLDGTITGLVAGDGITVIYSTTAANVPGAYPITAALVDPNGKLGNYTVSITNGTMLVTDGAPVAVADGPYTHSWNSPLTIAPNGVLTNDTDADGDPLTAAVVTGPAHGTLALNANGGFTYTPAADFSGADSFTYKANDGFADSAVATASLVITSPCSVSANHHGRRDEDEWYGWRGDRNDWDADDCQRGTPIARDDAYRTNQGDTLTVMASRDILENDGRYAAAALLVSGPAHGALTLNPNGTFVYVPDAAYYGLDSFVYAARSASGVAGPVAMVKLTVRKNLAPDADNDFYSVKTNATLTIAAAGVLKNDSDPDDDALTAAVVTGPSHGTLTLAANGAFVYKPAPNFTGTDTFTYRAVDTFGHADTATVSIKVSQSGRDDDDHHGDESHHRNGDDCDHERGRNGHFRGDRCEHDRSR